MRFRGSIGSVAAFWVSGSGRAYADLSTEIEQLAGRASLATASFGEKEVGAANADAKLKLFAQTIRNR